MTNTTDLTSPEAVERLAKTCDVASAIVGRRRLKAQHAHYKNCAATLRALSAERDELKQSLEKAATACSEQARARGEAEGKLAASEMAGIVDGWKGRAEAAEGRERALLQSNDQERKALVENASIRHRLKAAEAELAEAKMHVAEMITAFEEHVALPDKNCSCHISPPCGDCTENDYARETLSEARAFRARQKETDT